MSSQAFLAFSRRGHKPSARTLTVGAVFNSDKFVGIEDRLEVTGVDGAVRVCYLASGTATKPTTRDPGLRIAGGACSFSYALPKPSGNMRMPAEMRFYADKRLTPAVVLKPSDHQALTWEATSGGY